ncbi:MAG: PEGA domain-containing protein [Deltaproteobacteria bacterium]
MPSPSWSAPVSIPLLASLAALAVSALAPRIEAQPVPVFLVQGGNTDESATAFPAVNRVAAAVGPSAQYGAALARGLAEHYGAPAPQGDPLARVRERARVSRGLWSDAATAGDTAGAERALDSLDAAAREIEAAPDASDANPENLASLQQALLFLAERWDTAGLPTRAADAMRRLARVDPAIAFTARAASPTVQQLYASAVAGLPRGALSVDSAPPGCTVIRDGRPVGAAPVELQDLAQGRHRIQVQCGGSSSLVHPVDVVARTRATLVIDTTLDAALALAASTPALRYPSLALARPRLASDLALLGRAVGARRACAVIASEDRVVVIDVSASSEVGDGPVTDGSRLRALMTQPVAVSPVLASAPPDGDSGRTERARPAVVVHRSGGGASGAAIALGVVGLAGVGAGAYGAVASVSATNRAEQSEDAQTRAQAAGAQRTWQVVEIAGFAAGGALVLTGVLVAVFARGHDDVTTVNVRATALPEGGAWMGVGRAF